MTSDFTEAELTEAFEYLDELRASGRVNMWASHAFLARDLLWPEKDASEATELWMNTFAKDRSVPERVTAARAQGMAPEGRGREGGPGSSELPSPVAESDAPKGATR